VRMEQDWAMAVAVTTGELNAQEAFVTGRIRFFGDQQLLIDSQSVFAALDGVFAAVRERTQYE
jgi:putative sterol carrier protein